MDIGLIGLGKMGYNIALNMKDHGHNVVAYDCDAQKVREGEKDGFTGAYSVEKLVKKFQGRKVIWLMVPAGKPVDDTIDALLPVLNENDIIIDGGNSHYRDTLGRYEKIKSKGIDFVDVGTSGGIEGARHGACTMVGAQDEVFKYIEPLIKDISVENGYLHTGTNGTGHFVKMVHNGIEYGMLEAIGEGFEVLERSQFQLNFKKIARVWNHGSVIRGWLMELMENVFKKDPKLDDIKGVIHSNGEGLWTVQEALKLNIAIPVIAESLFTRFRSEKDDTFTGKVIAALRNEFGGHKVEKSNN